MTIFEELSLDRGIKKRGAGLASSAFSLVSKTLRHNPVGAIVNKAIDALPIELHLPGYHYCGPGTKLKERLARNDSGINKLDQACKEHDIAYSKYSDSANRSIADRTLADRAWQRVKSSDASFGERAAALSVAAAMKAKTSIGGGKRRKGRKKSVKKGGNIRKKRDLFTGPKLSNGRKKKKIKSSVWTMIKKGKGLYLKPYHRVY